MVSTRATEMASRNIFELLGIGRILLRAAQIAAQFRLDAAPRTPDSLARRSGDKGRDCLNHTLEAGGNERSGKTLGGGGQNRTDPTLPGFCALTSGNQFCNQ